MVEKLEFSSSNNSSFNLYINTDSCFVFKYHKNKQDFSLIEEHVIYKRIALYQVLGSSQSRCLSSKFCLWSKTQIPRFLLQMLRETEGGNSCHSSSMTLRGASLLTASSPSCLFPKIISFHITAHFPITVIQSFNPLSY